MKKEYDVVVIGTGPSGAAAARGLLNESMDVLIIDKKKLPRYKMCSGIIFEKAHNITNKHFGEIPATAYATPELLKGVRLWKDETNYGDWEFSKNGKGAPNVWRSEYDYWLTTNTGAYVKDRFSLLHFKVNDGIIFLKCHDISNDKIVDIKCRYLVSAEGCKSVIRKQLDPEFENGLKWVVACQYYYEGSSYLDPYFFHGFTDSQYGDLYAWFNVKDKMIVFGTAVKKGNKVKPYLLKYTEYLKKNFGLKLKKLVKKSVCMGNDMCPRDKFYLGEGNVLLVGEGAGFINAFGEGISCALSTGLFAAEAIKKSIKSKEYAIQAYTEITKMERRLTRASWKLGDKITGRNLMPI